MREFRMGSGTREYYTSFEEVAKAWGCKPVKKKTDDEKKLANQQEVFCGKHKCKACGKPMTWVFGNVMACTNEACKGIKKERLDKEGNKVITYLPSYDLLDETGADIAYNIFS